MENIKSKILNASKWSIITEIIAKCISPVTSMILARILAPEAFGVLTTVMMVIAFAEVFVESGFQKYLIQHKFESEEQELKYMSVAFWANVAVGLVLWGVIVAFNNQIAELVGSPGKGHLLIITGVTVPLYGIVGIQVSKLKKDLNFKKLFYVRIVSALVPLFITIPLALLGLDYWALIIGNISGVAINCLILFVLKSFKPKLYFSWAEMYEMLSYGIWTLLNGIAIWLTSWIDAFLIGRFLTEYYLGLYKNSVNSITSIFTIVTAAITPVLFSSLSKLQDDDKMFSSVFLNIERTLAMLLIPMGVGLLLYQDFATEILLGEQWKEASKIIGITSFTTAIRTVYISLNGDVFRAKGYFKIPLILQIIDLTITVPLCYFSLLKSFWCFVYVRAFSKMILLLPEICLLQKKCGISPKAIIQNSIIYCFATIIMSTVAIILKHVIHSFLWDILSVIICMAVYIAVLMCIPDERNRFITIIKKGK